MAILLKRSTVSGVVPHPTELDIGEVAVNAADARLFTKRTDGTVGEIGGYLPSVASVATPPAGSYYLTAHTTTQTYATVAGVANRVNWCPYIAQRNYAITALAAFVTTAVAGSFIRVGIYADDGTGVPTGAALAVSADLDSSTTGLKETAVSVSLSAGTLYWLAFHSSSTATVRAYSRLGLPELYNDPSTTVGINGWYRNGMTFASGLPSVPSPIYPYGTTTPATFLKV